MRSIVMSPAPGERLVRHVGDSIRFSIAGMPAPQPSHGWRARLRTTLCRGQALREEIIRAHTERVPPFGASWHDVPLDWDGSTWSRELVLTEVGYFPAKAYLVDSHGFQHWPEGPDFGLSVHPDWCRSANLLYCAFVRLFGESRSAAAFLPEAAESQIKSLEGQGFAVLPPSGTFRDLCRQIPHIVQRLGCRIIQLLPIHPAPTTLGRFGRMGSPYAALDLTAVDPALVEFDRRTTGVDQFCELARMVHHHGAKLFLDVVINHTGWGSRLFEEHPEFFRREPGGQWASPGAWDVVWEDLVELEQVGVVLWDQIAEALLTWCRRGVDGFRCDAGYKIPTGVWQYLTARVRTEFPDTVFLLEGLGGPWEATEALLAEGGMQWAYSELFQNDSGAQVQSYLDYALRQGERVGTYVHYSETHDNNRLAARGRAWSLLRNRLCALASIRGSFGFTCGVEWLAQEKIRVHERTGLAWGNPAHIIEELAALNELLADHPVFFDGAHVRCVGSGGAAVLALERISEDGEWRVLILINTHPDRPADARLQAETVRAGHGWTHELLGQKPPPMVADRDSVTFTLPPLGVYCLSPKPRPERGFGVRIRQQRERVAWALQQAAVLVPAERLTDNRDRVALAAAVEADPAGWLAAFSEVARERSVGTPGLLALGDILERWKAGTFYPAVQVWWPEDVRRATVVPPGWWLVVRDQRAFRAHLEVAGATRSEHASGIAVAGGFAACFAPRHPAQTRNARLILEHFDGGSPRVQGEIRFLADSPAAVGALDPDGLVLLTNGRGGMARLRIDLGNIRSKYDCVLGANLHRSVPVDRHVFAKRIRVWINADGFISALDRYNLAEFTAGPAPRWRFRANAGDGRTVTVVIEAAMLWERNTVLFRFSRSTLDAPLAVSLTVRVDLEDRSYHAETHRNAGADHHFAAHCHLLAEPPGFDFAPAAERRLRVQMDRGLYHSQPEWSERIAHPFERTRGQVGEGDAYSPGWFQASLDPGESALLCLDAEPATLGRGELPAIAEATFRSHVLQGPSLVHADWFADHLIHAAEAFLVRRDHGRTVVAGYPWFLDWGRDSLIAARGLLSAGKHREVLQIIDVLGRFAERGTLPNAIHGENASNRDTSDAPLWYAVVLEEAAIILGDGILLERVAAGGPTRLDVVRGLVAAYRDGTAHGVAMDPGSKLIWSPAHFTWMDTNHPAGTPREGYPVEIQALWIRALRFLGRVDVGRRTQWLSLAKEAEESLQRSFWIEESGWYADVLHAPRGTAAAEAVRDNSLRPNMLFAITFKLASAIRARRSVAAALRHLVVPGALRSLAPLPVAPPLAIRAGDGRLLNDPERPYQGVYEGDEDTRRKPAYHNGTAWVWCLPVFCEALAAAWDNHPAAVRAARAMLGSMDQILHQGCRGQLPEILDGDSPHTERGCDAQAWSVTETLRVWRIFAG
jgi:predicted glycogen debranching enzyme